MPSRYDYQPGFKPVWTIQRFSDTYWRADCIRSDILPNLTEIVDRRTALDWADLFVAAEAEVIRANEDLGAKYVNAARQIHEER
jgi:hypothetical protein